MARSNGGKPVAATSLPWLVALVLVFLVRCTPEAPKDYVEAELFEHTTLLEADSMELLVDAEPDGSRLVFEGTTAEIEELAPGRVVLAMDAPLVPYGVLRRVEEVERDADRTIVTSSPTSMLFAFRRLTVHIEDRPLEGSDRAAPPVEFRVGGGKVFQLSGLEWAVEDGDGEPGGQDQILLKGDLWAGGTFSFDLGFDWGELFDPTNVFDLDPTSVLDKIGFHTKFEVDLVSGAKVELLGASSLEYGDEKSLGPPLVLGVVGIPPVVFVPRLHAIAKVEGAASDQFTIHVEQEAKLKIGMSIEGNDPPKLIGGVPELTASNGAATVGAKAHGKVSIEPRIELLAYGLFGPYAGLDAYAKLDSDQDKDPCWELSAGLDADFGLYVDLIVTSAGKGVTKNLTEKVFADGDCELPPGGGGAGGSLDPLFTPWARAYEGAIWQAGTRDDRTELTLTHDGRFVLTSTEADALLKIDPDGTPVWAYAFERDIPDADRELTPGHAVPRYDTGLWVTTARGGILSLDAAGGLQSAAELDFVDPHQARIGSAIQTNDHGLILVGDSPLGTDEQAGFVVRFDAELNVAWARRFGGDALERPEVVLEHDGGFLIAGHGLLEGWIQAWVLRLDENGQTEWFRRLSDCDLETGGIEEDDLEIRSATVNLDGHYVLGGARAYGEYYALLMSLSPEGKVGWATESQYGNFLGINVYQAEPLPTGGYLAVGNWVSGGTTDQLWLGETDAIGRFSWMQAYHGGKNDVQPSMWVTPEDNGVLVASASTSFVADPVQEPADAFVLKLPRKDGAIDFTAASGALTAALTPAPSDACILAVPYDGTVDPLAAALIPLDDVSVTPVTVTSSVLSQ